MNQTVDTLRRQLHQLKELHDGGALNRAQYEQNKAALERTLLNLVLDGAAVDSPATPAAPAAASVSASPRPSRRLLLGAGGVVVAVAALGYWWAGSPTAIAAAPLAMPAQATASGVAPHALGNEQMAAMVDKLASRLKSAPEDAEGWAMLARSYAVLGRHADAVPAFQRAVALRGDDATLLADYADALAVKNNSGLAGEPLKLVQRALELDPGNIKALSLAGTEAFDRKDYAAAVKHWQHLVDVGPADSPIVQQVTSAIAEARDLGKLPAAPASPSKASVATAPARITGTVALAAALARQASPDDTVFVFARAADGPRMPLAIVRKQVKDLPFDFALDDGMAMSPAAKMSNFAKIVVSARVSKTGDANPAPGDLSGQSSPVALGASGLRVVIDGVVGK
ncbi:MAG TPA: c-type cytochrome biogenesis protein CcmI [Albitalea sp.]|nr:c-type cytochrome biogenesis protein CcmI [Albitalea sp.]